MRSVPDVTIVVPTRDQLGGLRRALAGIGCDPLAEILVIDDASRDGTAAWLGQAAAADRRLRVLRGEGMGRARACNLGIAAARAPLVAFLDAGDVWCHGRLGRQRALHAGHPGIGFSFIGATRSAFLLDAQALAQQRARGGVALSGVVARTDLLVAAGGFGAGAADAAEWALWQRLAALAPVACLPPPPAATALLAPGPGRGLPLGAGGRRAEAA